MIDNIELVKKHKTFQGYTEFWSHSSKTTQCKMKFSTFRPEAEIQGCIIWLSGVSCTEENFIMKAGSQKYLSEKKLMVICPDTSPRGLNLLYEHDDEFFGSGASFYVNAITDGYKDHYRMYDYIIHDVYALVTDYFKISKNKISIMGHSMGGHGALTIGLKHPELFQAISVFAPSSNPSKGKNASKALKGYLGDDINLWKTYDATELIMAGYRHPKKILVDQGTEDPFALGLMTENFINACQQQGQNIQVRWREGYDHSYYYISTFIREHIEFHEKALK